MTPWKRALFGSSLITATTLAALPSVRADEMVTVTLEDKGMESMRMELSAGEIRSGKVTFHVTNASENFVHEFVVAKSDKPIELLPYNEEEKALKEDTLKVVNEIENIEPGKPWHARHKPRAGFLHIALQ